MGRIKDHTGSYAGGLLLLAALGIIAMGVVLMLGQEMRPNTPRQTNKRQHRLSSKRDQTYCARHYPYTRDLLNSNLAFRSFNFMVRTECGPTLRRTGHLTVALTVLPRERQPVMRRRDTPGWSREEGSMIANHTERQMSRIRTSLAVPAFGFLLFKLHILVDGMGGGSLPHLAAEEGRTLER